MRSPLNTRRKMNIPLVDLKAQYGSIREEIDEAVWRVIERGEFILGSEVEAFEEEMAAFNAPGYDRIHTRKSLR